MKKELAVLSLLAVLSASPAAAQTCYPPELVIKAETMDGSIAVSMTLEETTAFRKELTKLFPQPDTNFDSAIAFTQSANKVTRVVYFFNGCATKFVDLSSDDFIKIITGTPA